jgi:hypothetical protein
MAGCGLRSRPLRVRGPVTDVPSIALRSGAGPGATCLREVAPARSWRVLLLLCRGRVLQTHPAAIAHAAVRVAAGAGEVAGRKRRDRGQDQLPHDDIARIGRVTPAGLRELPPAVGVDRQGRAEDAAFLRQRDMFTKDPLGSPLNLRQVVGNPFIVPESLWVPPTRYESEGPLVVAAPSCLTGLDTFYWFATGAEEGAWDPNRDKGALPEAGPSKAAVDPLAYLVGRADVNYGGDPAKSTVANLSTYVDLVKKTVRSVTGQITTDLARGLYLVDAPQAHRVWLASWAAPARRS